MFLKKSYATEIADNLEKNLATSKEQKIASHKTKQIIELLALAGNLLDQAGMEKEADLVSGMLSVYATHDSATEGLSDEKMVENLKDHGFVLNLNEADDLEMHDMKWLMEAYPEAYQALPETYQADPGALKFYLDINGDLFAEDDFGFEYMYYQGSWDQIS